MIAPVGLLDLGKGCRYPVSGEGASILFCGAARRGLAEIESYCEEHHKLCRVKPAKGSVKPISWKHKLRVGV